MTKCYALPNGANVNKQLLGAQQKDERALYNMLIKSFMFFVNP